MPAAVVRQALSSGILQEFPVPQEVGLSQVGQQALSSRHRVLEEQQALLRLVILLTFPGVDIA